MISDVAHFIMVGRNGYASDVPLALRLYLILQVWAYGLHYFITGLICTKED